MIADIADIGIIVTALLGAVICAATLVITIPLLDDPIIQFAVAFIMTSTALMSLANAVFHCRLQWKRHRLTRARKRARTLLLRLLTPTQRDQYLAGLPITVPIIIEGKHIGMAQIGGGISGVVWYSNGNSSLAQRRRWHWISGRQCIAVSAPEDVPEDDLVALLLWLRGDPQGLSSVSSRVVV